MTIVLRERFEVKAGIEDVWAFLIDPHRVASCVPGARLDRVESERVFHGTLKFAIWPFSTHYRGRVEFVELDAENHRARLTAEGEEHEGGLARGQMVSTLTSIAGGTEICAEIRVEGTNRIVQMGLGWSKEIGNTLFAEFVDCLKEHLEAKDPASVHDAPQTVELMPLLAKTLMNRVRAWRNG